jgi:uncharacterized membrane protein
MPKTSGYRARPFRTAVLRGLGAFLPPLLTVLILIWAVNTTRYYILEPLTYAAKEGMLWLTADIRDDVEQAKPGDLTVNISGQTFHRLHNGSFVPENIYDTVRKADGIDSIPGNGQDLYRRYIELTVLQPYFAIPVFLAVFILLLYMLGKFMSIGFGGYFTSLLEGGVRRLPLVRNVYSAVKQISEFIFSEREFKFTRIVAVEFPRKGTWQLGFVTGEGMAEINTAVGEPILTVLVPYSPLPVTGCTISVRKSECIDLDITFDQACEYIVSCGVVVPSLKLNELQTGSLPASNPSSPTPRH